MFLQTSLAPSTPPALGSGGGRGHGGDICPTPWQSFDSQSCHVPGVGDPGLLRLGLGTERRGAAGRGCRRVGKGAPTSPFSVRCSRERDGCRAAGGSRRQRDPRGSGILLPPLLIRPTTTTRGTQKGPPPCLLQPPATAPPCTPPHAAQALLSSAAPEHPVASLPNRNIHPEHSVLLFLML